MDIRLAKKVLFACERVRIRIKIFFDPPVDIMNYSSQDYIVYLQRLYSEIQRIIVLHLYRRA